MRIRELREQRNWSQQELSERSSIPQNLISNYETNVRKPNAGTMERLAKAFGIKVSELFE